MASKRAVRVCNHRHVDKTTNKGMRTERVGEGLGELDISDWTCFACGGKLTQAHEGDYFHTDAASTCTENVPVPTSLVESSLKADDTSR
jgi:hypothetical protein